MRNDATRDANWVLPSTVARSKAKAAAAAGDRTALDAILAADKVARVKRIARWESEAAGGNEEATVKLAAYKERSASVDISEPRWDEVLGNVSRLLKRIDSPALRIMEAEAHVDRLFSQERAANLEGATTYVFCAGLANVVGDDGCLGPDEAFKMGVNLPFEVAEYQIGFPSAFMGILRMMSADFVRVDSQIAVAVDD